MTSRKAYTDLMLFHGGDHGLAAGVDGPQPYQSLPTSAHNVLAVPQAFDGGHSLMVCVMNGE